MSASGDALASLVDLLASQIAPEPVVVNDGSGVVSEQVGTVVRPLALDRVGRSHREGAILDLELTVAVTTHGPHAVDMLERHLVTIERSQFSARPLTPASARAGSTADDRLVTALGLVVAVPVSVRLEEPLPPIVTQPPVVRVQPLSGLEGTVVDADRRGIRGAVIRSSTTGMTSVSDGSGRFRLLTTGEPTRIDVSVRGRHHTVEVGAVGADGAPTRSMQIMLDGEDGNIQQATGEDTGSAGAGMRE